MISEGQKRESPFTVRAATYEDLDQCVGLAHEIPLENDWGYFPQTSNIKVINKLKELIDSQTLIVYDNNGVIVGILGVVVDSFWWTEEPMLMDVVFYIKPEFRSYKAYNRMLSVAEEFAKINGLPLSLLFFTTKDTERKFNMVQRRGYKSIGFWVTKQRE